MRLTPDVQEPAELADPDDLVSRFYLRINAMDKPEALDMLSRVTRARNYAKKQDDEELRARLNEEWQMLLDRVMVAWWPYSVPPSAVIR